MEDEAVIPVHLLRQQFEEAAEGLLRISEQINHKLQLLEEQENKMKQLEEKMAQNAASLQKVVKLNVQGTIFMTAKDNLLRMPNTYFDALLSSGLWSPTEDGSYFIDRSPTHFGMILEYLRTGEFNQEGLSKRAILEILKELDYYQIPVPSCLTPRWDINTCGKYLEVSDDLKTVTKSSRLSSSSYGGILAETPVHNFKVRVNTGGRFNVGFANRDTFCPNAKNYHKCGWYLFALNGTLWSQNGDHQRPYAVGVSTGSTIEATYDASSRRISFSVDKYDYGIAFQNVPNENLYPAVEIIDVGVSITLLSS